MEARKGDAGGSNGKPPPPSCSIFVRIQVQKIGREKGIIRGKGKYGRAALGFVLHVQVTSDGGNMTTRGEKGNRSLNSSY